MYNHEYSCKYVFKKRKTMRRKCFGVGFFLHVNRPPRKAKSSSSSTWHHLTPLIVQSGAFLTEKGGD